MQHDEVVWMVIGRGFCAFKSRIETSDFCRNPYNVTGLCNKASCPLANSRYATIREEGGKCFLCMKTAERMHTPNKWWEKVQLSDNYATALQQIDQHLEFWPKYLIHRNKQRLTKIHQYLIRMRKLSTKVQPELVRVHKKVEQREARREKKALAAAQLEKAIEAELLERLQKGVYPEGIYNFPERQYNKVLGEAAAEQEVDDGDEEAEAETEGAGEDDVEYVEEDEEEGGSDVEDMEQWEKDLERQMAAEGFTSPFGQVKKAGPRVEIEYEEEREGPEAEAQASGSAW